MLTLCSFSLVRLSETFWPALLNTRSDSTDVAGMQKYLKKIRLLMNESPFGSPDSIGEDLILVRLQLSQDTAVLLQCHLIARFHAY